MKFNINIKWLLNDSKMIQRARLKKTETLYMIAVNKENKYKVLWINDSNKVDGVCIGNADIREMQKDYEKFNAVGFIVIHNHPKVSYDTPTANDIVAYTQYRKVFKVLGMNMLDSIVVSEDNYYSIRQLACIL